MKTRYFFLITVMFLFMCIPVNSQKKEQKENTDTSAVKVIDSLKNDELSKSTQILKSVDSIRTADSLRMQQLNSQIDELKTTDNLKKDELQKELTRLRTADSLKKIERLKRIDSLRSITKGFPVVSFNDTLFVIYSKLGPFSPKDRAETIQNKVKKLYDNPDFNGDSLSVFDGEQSSDIMYEDMIILSITDADALWIGKTRSEAARDYKERIKNNILSQIEENSLKNTLIRIGFALLTILGLFFILKYANKLFSIITLKVEANKERYFKGIKIKNYELFDKERMSLAVLFLLKILKILIILVVSYFFLTILFGIFPTTKGIAETLLGYILNPVGKMWKALVSYLPNLLAIIVIMIVTRYILKFVHFLTKEVESGELTLPGFYSDWAQPTFNIIRVLILAFMFIVIFPYLPGSDSPVFQGVTVFLGILFSLGSSTAISNMVAGIVITYMRPFKIGDRVKIGEVVGDVVSKNMLVTRVRTIKNEEITIPNSNVMSNHTINFSSSAKELGLIMHTTVTIGYDVPWKKVHELLINSATETIGLLNEPKPFVLQTSLDDFYVSYQVNAYTNEANKQATIYSLLHQNIQDKFNESGVEIMSPHYKALRDGNLTTIPADYLPADYVTPFFNIKEGNKNQ
ncbi:MAG: mechanosensitive ion channel [Ignavibacteria bacterium]|nr:mechanosensitive ion channel [Ignavibacteria bacterium]